MRLNKIKLSGFKSFVDSTTIVFPSNLMGIVGPNGCGKSNVIDAIRWVLGESSAKTLRGDSMADVIFNGSGGRKPVGQASIELTFDNTDGTVSGAYASYSEIAIRRVITRDGTSQYFLNNSRCRRKDVTQLLLGTGLGAHGYSIIEQGMISRLVDARPEDLRAFLEEAAGISKYKERRRETEHRIRHTRDNLERLSDLREEIDKQLAHLQRQARAAERYKVLKSEERRTTAELLSLRLKAMRGALDERASHLREKQLALEAAQTERGRVESEIEKSRVAHAEAVEEFNKVQGDYYHVGAEIARLEQGIKHRRELRQRQTEDLERSDVKPADIELPPLVRQPGRNPVSVVVVMQFLTADQNAPRHDISGSIFCLEVAVSPVVSDAVDHSGGPERNPCHLHEPDRDACKTEKNEVDQQHRGNAGKAVRIVKPALDPVVRRAVAEILQRLAITRLIAVKKRPAKKHFQNAEVLRAVRILFELASRVVLAMDGHPLGGHHARREPEPEPEEMGDDRMQLQTAMRLMAMQVNRHGRNRHVRKPEGDPEALPETYRNQSVCHVILKSV